MNLPLVFLTALLYVLVPVAADCYLGAVDGADSFRDAVLLLSGASSMEELSAEELERYEDLRRKPLDLNRCSRSRLLACGLFTPFQVASILEQRRQSGEILSLTELMLIEGFTSRKVDALRHFIVIRAEDGPIGAKKLRPELDLELRGAVSVPVPDSRSKDRGEQRTGYGSKLHLSLGQRAELSIVGRKSYDSGRFGPVSASAVYYGRRYLGKVVLGAFNARFGEGLTQWSGFSLSSLSSVASFRKSGSGLSPSASFSPGMTGMAADFNLRRFTLSTAIGCAPEALAKLSLFTKASGSIALGSTAPGIAALADLSWTGRLIHAGVTATCEAAGAHFLGSLPNLSLFGETSLTYKGAFSAIAGTVWTPEYARKFALQLRWFAPSIKGKNSGAAFGFELPDWCFTLDARYRADIRKQKYRGFLRYSKEIILPARPRAPSSVPPPEVNLPEASLPDISSRPVTEQPATVPEASAGSASVSVSEASVSVPARSLTVSARLAANYAPGESHPTRVELRSELAFTSGAWKFSTRLDGIYCASFAFHAFLEEGYLTPKLSSYLRLGGFLIDNWDDRIWVYERDAPGSFTVPAYYGRGVHCSLYCAWKPSRHHSLYLRTSLVSYPGNPTPKNGKFEFKLQYRLRIF
ncbi:MAG: hypothetical protein PUD85_05645 [Bacteroidales bacterium]|nr:hypothetical protein [Bacteroidales bacterium]